MAFLFYSTRGKFPRGVKVDDRGALPPASESVIWSGLNSASMAQFFLVKVEPGQTMSPLSIVMPLPSLERSS